MTDTEKLNLLIKSLEKFAYERHCYDEVGIEYDYPYHTCDAFNDGSEYGEVSLARTMLKQIGEMNYDRIGEND